MYFSFEYHSICKSTIKEYRIAFSFTFFSCSMTFSYRVQILFCIIIYEFMFQLYIYTVFFITSTVMKFSYIKIGMEQFQIQMDN